MLNTIELYGHHGKLYKTAQDGSNYVFEDTQRDNYVVVTTYDNEDLDTVFGGLNDTRYDYIIKLLNENKNLTVHISKVEGTTTDFKVFYDFKISDEYILSYPTVIAKLKEVIKQPFESRKFTQIVDGTETPINPDMMK